jgi:hypothetical protein
MGELALHVRDQGFRLGIFTSERMLQEVIPAWDGTLGQFLERPPMGKERLWLMWHGSSTMVAQRDPRHRKPRSSVSRMNCRG